MNVNDVLAVMSADVAKQFKTAIEIGKWPNGQKLSPEQTDICMEALLIWEAKNLPETERTGYIDRGTKAKDEVCASHTHEVDEQLLTIRH